MSTNIIELSNEPINFEIGGRTLKIQRLNLKEVFGYFEKQIKEQHLKNIKDVASVFTDSADRMKYLTQATKEMPNKVELQRMAQDYLSSEAGIADLLQIGLNKCQKVSDQELVDIFTKAAEAEIQLLIHYLLGLESKTEDPAAPASTEKKM